MRIVKDFHRPLTVGVLRGNLEDAVGADRQEVARGMVNVEGSCVASSRLQGLSLDPVGGHVAGERPAHQQGLWHYTVARTVDGCVLHVLPYYGLARSDPAIAQLYADSSGGAPGSEASAPATTVAQNG